MQERELNDRLEKLRLYKNFKEREQRSMTFNIPSLAAMDVASVMVTRTARVLLTRSPPAKYSNQN
jgi:hypothetical protein